MPYQSFGYRKPPFGTKLDLSHPLAGGLQVAVLFNEGTGTNIRNEGQAEISGDVLNRTDPWNTLDGDSHPVHTDYAGTDDVVDFGTHSRTAIDYGNAGRMTICALIRAEGTGTVCAKRDGATAEFQLLENTDRIDFLIGGTSGTIITAAQGFARNAWQLVGANADATGNVTGFIQGNQATTIDLATPARVDVNLSIGARWEVYPTTGFQLNGQIAFVYIWIGRLLSVFEHQALAADPYQMFEDRPRNFSALFAEAAALTSPSMMTELKSHVNVIGY